MTILSLVLVTVFLAVVATFTATPQYESRAQLFVATPQSDNSQAYQGGLFSVQRATSYVKLLTGSEVTSRALTSSGAAISPDELSSKVTANVVPDTVIIEVALRDASPEQAQLLLKELTRQFVEYVNKLEAPPNGDPAPVRVAVTDAASLPTTSVSPNLLLNVLAGIALGVVLGMGTAAAREALDNTVKSGADLERVTATPIFAAFKFDRAVPKQPLISSLPPHHPRAEATRILRTNLQFSAIDRANKLIVVTSSVAGEGKSTISCNLAIAEASAGRRVLLVEGDLRRPRVGAYLGLENSVGLTTVLLGDVKLEDALQNVGATGLEVLTSGRLPPNPSEIIQTEATANLLAQLKDEFDVVIVDAPPLLPVTDASLLAAYSDAVVLVVRHGKTTLDQLTASMSRIEAVGARASGVVLNMTPGRSRAYGYEYGYESDYSPGSLGETKTRRGRRSR